MVTGHRGNPKRREALIVDKIIRMAQFRMHVEPKKPENKEMVEKNIIRLSQIKKQKRKI